MAVAGSGAAGQWQRSGGASGAPLALWQNNAKRTEIQGILDDGDTDVMIMICCSENFFDTGVDEGVINWMDYALARNPSTRFAMAVPWMVSSAEG